MARKSKKNRLLWPGLFILTGAVDLIQIIIAFTGVGIIVSEILEAIMPFALIGTLAIFGVPLIQHPGRLISILGVDVADALTGGIAPFWILDVWYIYNDVKKKEVENTQREESEDLMRNFSRQPLNNQENNVRFPVNTLSERAGPKNVGGVRPPRGRVLR